jgi:hypothetical protein
MNHQVGKPCDLEMHKPTPGSEYIIKESIILFHEDALDLVGRSTGICVPYRVHTSGE